jgi:hypothetical protein
MISSAYPSGMLKANTKNAPLYLQGKRIYFLALCLHQIAKDDDEREILTASKKKHPQGYYRISVVTLTNC